MRNVFDAAAPSYIRDDEHWGSDLDVLKDTFESYLKKRGKQIRYLDIGCGPGFHVLAMRQLYPEASVSGIDDSPRMLREARKQISRLQLNVKLTRANILDFRVGMYDVASFLNNGFGNLGASDLLPLNVRTLAMAQVRKLLRRDGSLIVSVYNLEKLQTHTVGIFVSCRGAT